MANTINNLPQMRLKLLQKDWKTVEATGDFIGNKIAIKTTNVTKNSKTVINGNDEEIPKEISRERYIYLQKKREYIIDTLRLI